MFRHKWKAILVALVVGITSFTIGSYANQVVVQQVQSIGGKHVTVPAPELKVLDTSWNLDYNNSQITDLLLTLTTTGAPGATGSRTYQVEVQVSCLAGTAVVPNCDVGVVLVKAPVNLNGTAIQVPVALSHPIDPETIEIDDLSFIVTGVQNFDPDPCFFSVSQFGAFAYCWWPPPIPCEPPHFTLTSNITTTPSFTGGGSPTVTLQQSSVVNSVHVAKIATSMCNYSGTVKLSAGAPSDIWITFSPVSQFIPSGLSKTYTETISTCLGFANPVPSCSGPSVPGSHLVMNIATDGSKTVGYLFTVNVV